MGQLLQRYDVISIFQDGGRGRSILLPVSYLLMSLPSKGQNLSTNQITSKKSDGLKARNFSLVVL